MTRLLAFLKGVCEFAIKSLVFPNQANHIFLTY